MNTFLQARNWRHFTMDMAFYKHKEYNRACRPGGIYWDYHPDVLSWSQCNSCADQAPVNFIHGCPIWWSHQMEAFPRYWPFVRGVHRSSVDSVHKGQWRGTLMFTLTCAWTNARANNRVAGDLGRHRAYYDVTVIDLQISTSIKTSRMAPRRHAPQ